MRVDGVRPGLVGCEPWPRQGLASTPRGASGDVVEGVAPPLDGRAVQSSDRVPTPDTVAFIVTVLGLVHGGRSYGIDTLGFYESMRIGCRLVILIIRQPLHSLRAIVHDRAGSRSTSPFYGIRERWLGSST